MNLRSLQIFFLLLTGITINAQVNCHFCRDFDTKSDIDVTPRFWQDPDGIVYLSHEVIVPDKVGLWLYYKQNDGDDNQNVISTRYVHCVNEIEQRNVKSLDNKTLLYPNPVTSILNIVHDKPVTTIQIRNMNGQVITAGNYRNQFKFSVDVSSYLNGLYTITIVSEQEVLSKVFVVN